MTAVVALLLVNGVLGIVDTLWYHEWRARLAERPDLYRTELRLHAARDAVYAVLYGTIAWWAWSGSWVLLLGGLLAVEIVITMSDFVVEDRTRVVRAGERVLHAAMAIVYGAMLMQLVPDLVDRLGQPDALVGAGPDASVPTHLAVAASMLGGGIALSGVRDLLASYGVGTRLVATVRPGPVSAGSGTASRAVTVPAVAVPPGSVGQRAQPSRPAGHLAP